jgi:regulator of sigma E protease
VSFAWLAPILVLGLVIFVHELGHFLAAKLCGVYAPRFSLGWGSPLWRWRPKGSETEYVISWLPIGGYVRMASRDDETMAKIEGGGESGEGQANGATGKYWDPEAMIPHGPKPIPESRWFESKNTAQRVFILLAGVTMNAVLTVAIYVSVFAVNGKPVAPAVVYPVVGQVVPGMPAARAGMLQGDSVTAVDGVAVADWTEFTREVSARPNVPITFDLVRAGAPMQLSVTAEAQQVSDSATGVTRQVGRIGIRPLVRAVYEPVGIGEATQLGLTASRARATEVFDVLSGLIRGQRGMNELGGPIAIARASVQTAQSGLVDLLDLIAMLSINLAILNLLPVPILDGGQIIVTLTEGVRGKPLTIKTRENLMKAGVAFILVLFAVVMFNDIKSLVQSWFS